MHVVDAHKAVGGLVIALNLLVGLWGLWAWRQHAVASPLLAQLLAFSHTIVLLEAAFGLYLLTGGYRSGQGCTTSTARSPRAPCSSATRRARPTRGGTCCSSP